MDAVVNAKRFPSDCGKRRDSVATSSQSAFAHIVAFNPFTGETIAAFADENGDYEIEGLSALRRR